MAIVASGTAPRVAGAASWSPAGTLVAPTYGHIAALLSNGKVLIAGGTVAFADGSAAVSNGAELYDPATNTWSDTPGNMLFPRMLAASAALQNGKVLVAGGSSDGTDSGDLANAELYDPVTGAWSLAGSMNSLRRGPVAATLQNGKVLVAAGVEAGPTCLQTADVYDPASNTWSPTGTMAFANCIGSTATLLPNGQVLVVSQGSTTAQLYDPASISWAPTGPMNFTRINHTATLLSTGKVLVAGGDLGFSTNQGCLAAPASCDAELYDPTTGQWSLTGSLITWRGTHTAALLSDGTVLVVGGRDETTSGSPPLASTEIYNPGSGTWSSGGSLASSRYRSTATRLLNGAVIAAGGLTTGSVMLGTAEGFGLVPTVSKLKLDAPTSATAGVAFSATVTAPGLRGRHRARLHGHHPPHQQRHWRWRGVANRLHVHRRR